MPDPKPLIAQLATALLMQEGKDTPPTTFRVFPAGSIETSKGVYKFTEASAAKAMAAAKQHGNDLAIDFNHGMHAFFSLDPAEAGKAAGWFKPTVRNGELHADDVRWTPKATEYLKNKEYRYFSPTFRHAEDGTIEELLSVALTNTPATYGMDPLMASRFGHPPSQPQESQTMDRKILIALLSLSEAATDADIQAALTRTNQALSELISLTGQKDAVAALGTVRGWQAGAGAVASLTQKITEMEKAKDEAELTALLDAGMKAGKVAPAQVASLRALPLVQLKAFLDAAPVMPAFRPATESNSGAGTTAALSAEALHVAHLMGIKKEDLAATIAAHGGHVPVGTMKKEAAK